MARPRKARGATATPSELQALIDAACHEARIKTQAHQLGWRHGEEDGWNLDQDDGVLVFTFADGSEVRCPAQIIGTFDGKTSTWLWAWNNPSIERSLLADSLALRAYGEEKGFDLLTEPKWPAEELDGWKMAALALKICEREGTYRGPAGATSIFMTFGAVTFQEPGSR